MTYRTNSEWLAALRSAGVSHTQALQALRSTVYRVCYGYLRKHCVAREILSATAAEQLAEDCTQETLMTVCDCLDQFRGASKFTTWVYAIAMRKVLGELRRQRWLRREQSIDVLQLETPQFPIDGSIAPDPEKMHQQQRAWELITRTIELELSPRQRAALLGHAFESIPLCEIATKLGTNRDNVYKLLHDARKKLKRSLALRGWSASEFLAVFNIE